MTKRSLLDTSQANAAAIKEINSVLRATVIMNRHNCKFYDKHIFKTTGFKKLVKDVAKHYNVSESSIKKIAGWNLDEIDL